MCYIANTRIAVSSKSPLVAALKELAPDLLKNEFKNGDLPLWVKFAAVPFWNGSGQTFASFKNTENLGKILNTLYARQDLIKAFESYLALRFGNVEELNSKITALDAEEFLVELCDDAQSDSV